MDENMILPDDFEIAQPQAEEIEPTEQQEVVEETPTEQQPQEPTEQPEEEPRIKVKYNHEEKELTLDEARELAQKGMNYDKTIEKLKVLENDPRLSFVERLARRNNMTIDEYLHAVEQAEYQEEIQKLVNQGISQEYAEEMLENRKFRLEQKEKERTQKQQQEEQEKTNKNYEGLLDAFNLINNRSFNADTDKIPADVFERAGQGLSLREAYLEHSIKELQNEIKVLKQNETNKKKAPVGGVTHYGSKEEVEEDDFLKGFNSIK